MDPQAQPLCSFCIEIKQGSKIPSPKYGLKKAFRVSEEHDSEREKKGNPFMAAYLRTFTKDSSMCGSEKFGPQVSCSGRNIRGNGSYTVSAHTDSDFSLLNKDSVIISSYMLVCIGVGIGYNLFQMLLSLSIGVSLLDLFGDMIIANILVSGAAATYGFTLELSRAADLEPTSFFNKIFIFAGLSLLATLLTPISLISYHVALRGLSR
ncbi:hypothetical protein BC332_30486 [Capsicum chinense]|nr:hypothetical protein BC332_30486 [Capsicum chinense]